MLDQMMSEQGRIAIELRDGARQASYIELGIRLGVSRGHARQVYYEAKAEQRLLATLQGREPVWATSPVLYMRYEWAGLKRCFESALYHGVGLHGASPYAPSRALLAAMTDDELLGLRLLGHGAVRAIRDVIGNNPPVSMASRSSVISALTAYSLGWDFWRDTVASGDCYAGAD